MTLFWKRTKNFGHSCYLFQDVPSADLKGATCSSTTCPRSLEMRNSCRCSSPLATSSAPRSSLTVPPTRANALALSALTIPPAPRRPSGPWMASRLEWRGSRSSSKGLRMPIVLTRWHNGYHSMKKCWRTQKEKLFIGMISKRFCSKQLSQSH